MNTFSTVLGGVIPVFAIALAGFVIRRVGWLTREADQSLLRMTINVLMPCLILDSVLGNPALSRWDNLLLPPLLGFGTVVGSMLIARVFARLGGIAESRKARTFSLTVGLHNYGYLPLPLAWLLFTKETVGVLFLYCVGVDLALWTVGVMTLTGASATGAWRRVLSPPLMAIVAAIGFNFSGLGEQLPAFSRTTFHLLGQCAMPMGLILSGAVVDDHLEEIRFTANWRMISTSLLLRLGILPLLFLGLTALFSASEELRQVMVLQAAMPSAVFPIVMARHYGGDTPTALRIVLATSVVGLITIPLWIRFGITWLSL